MVLLEKFCFLITKSDQFFYFMPEYLSTVTVKTSLVGMIMKNYWLLKESYGKPWQHIKNKRYRFADKGLYSQSYDFSSSYVWMWELDHKEGRVPKIDAFDLWCWSTRRSKQSILKKINPEYSLEELILKLKLPYFGHLMWSIGSLEKTLMLGKTGGRRRGRRQRMR